MSETPTIYEPNPYSVPLPEQVRHVMAVCVCCILFGLLAAVSLPFELQPALTDYLGWRGGTYGDHPGLATSEIIRSPSFPEFAVCAVYRGGQYACRIWPWAE